jgi:hypothetical protein
MRVLTNVYEAASIYKQEKCQESNKDYMPLWYLYSIVACNLLLVSFVKKYFGIDGNARQPFYSIISFLLVFL